jgi:NAD(P)H-flavin reductase
MSDSTDLFGKFEEKIAAFRRTPKEYRFSSPTPLKRQFDNAVLTFVIWLVPALVLNSIALEFFTGSGDKVSSSALIAIAALFFTVAARNYSVNHFLFETLGNRGKWYLLHQLANRIGFFHRFMALSTLIWLGVHLAQKPFQPPYKDEVIVVALTVLLALIILSALALFRRKRHNTFENIHRYIGYLATLLLFIYLFVLSFESGMTWRETLLSPHFVLMGWITLMLISPWIGVKKIHPKLVHVGEHVIGFQIEGEPSFGTFSRITLGSGYYHPFGDSMYHFDDTKNRTLYMTPAGDRTTEIIQAANRGEFLLHECWIKRDRPKGFMYQHSIYDHILIVVTGGGIAPIIPCLVLNKKTKMDVIWIGHSQEKEFTKEVLATLLDTIADHDISIHILDTDDEDLKQFNNAMYAALALEAYHHYKPEAVFVMSNQQFTIDLMHAFDANGIKSYGATFDS